jgi:hypothetical protein
LNKVSQFDGVNIETTALAKLALFVKVSS